MEQDNLYCKEIEIKLDLMGHIKVLIKRKKTFIAVFLLTFSVGIVYAFFSPKMYKISMMIRPPVAGPSLKGKDDLESAENLKTLIINGAYNEELKKISNPRLDKNNLRFNVEIANNTNILKVSVDLEGNKKEFGIALLNDLANLISNNYTKRIEAVTEYVINQIKLKESAIASAKEQINNLQVQIKEITARQDKLKNEMQTININTALMIENRDRLVKENPAEESANYLLIANYIQNSSRYLNQLNSQFSEISSRKIDLEFDLKNVDMQIDNLQKEIDKLNTEKGFISNLRIITQPKVLPDPLGPNKKKILKLTIITGLLLAASAVFLQEFLANKLVKNE